MVQFNANLGLNKVELQTTSKVETPETGAAQEQQPAQKSALYRGLGNGKTILGAGKLKPGDRILCDNGKVRVVIEVNEDGTAVTRRDKDPGDLNNHVESDRGYYRDQMF